MLFFGNRNQWCIALGLLIGSALSAGLSAQAEAHIGSRVFPIPELTDEMLAGIQLDGYVDEWFDLIGEPALTLVDFMDKFRKSTHDPADLDFRIWLAWQDEPARLYVAFVAADDDYKNTHTYDVDWIESFKDGMVYEGKNDGIVLGIDGDHSGSPGRDLSSPIRLERFLEITGTAQSYEAISRTPSGPTLDDWQSRYKGKTFSWMTLPPYAEARGSVAGEAPVIWGIELYITPFDHRGEDLTSPEGSVASEQIAPATGPRPATDHRVWWLHAPGEGTTSTPLSRNATKGFRSSSSVFPTATCAPPLSPLPGRPRPAGSRRSSL